MHACTHSLRTAAAAAASYNRVLRHHEKVAWVHVRCVPGDRLEFSEDRDEFEEWLIFWMIRCLLLLLKSCSVPLGASHCTAVLL